MKSHFISEYLTHWTDTGKQGYENLKSILSKHQLWLTKCTHFRPSDWQNAKLKMVCFTDIPLHLSQEHCKIYGKFAIAFKKSNFIKYGANPVLYISDFRKEDANTVYRYICDANTGKIKLDKDVLESLKKIFGFIQHYEYEDYTYFYEREWRILQNNLECSETTPLPGQCGAFINDETEKQYYFQFDPSDIAFLICPMDYVNKLTAFNNNYPILSYEHVIL